MSVEALRCPNCNAPLRQGMNECAYCGIPLVMDGKKVSINKIDRFCMTDEALTTTSLMVSQEVVQILGDEMPNLVNHSKLSDEPLVTSVAQLPTHIFSS